MKIFTRVAVATTALALVAGPAFGQAPEGTPGATDHPGATNHPTQSDNPGTARKLAAPGRYCKAESKKHVEGMKGTPFSVCVKAQAKLRSGATSSPREACKGESKKHADGAKGTPFSLCVSAGAKLLKDTKAQDEAAAEAPASS